MRVRSLTVGAYLAAGIVFLGAQFWYLSQRSTSTLPSEETPEARKAHLRASVWHQDGGAVPIVQPQAGANVWVAASDDCKVIAIVNLVQDLKLERRTACVVYGPGDSSGTTVPESVIQGSILSVALSPQGRYVALHTEEQKWKDLPEGGVTVDYTIRRNYVIDWAEEHVVYTDTTELGTGAGRFHTRHLPGFLSESQIGILERLADAENRNGVFSVYQVDLDKGENCVLWQFRDEDLLKCLRTETDFSSDELNAPNPRQVVFTRNPERILAGVKIGRNPIRMVVLDYGQKRITPFSDVASYVFPDPKTGDFLLGIIRDERAILVRQDGSEVASSEAAFPSIVYNAAQNRIFYVALPSGTNLDHHLDGLLPTRVFMRPLPEQKPRIEKI